MGFQCSTPLHFHESPRKACPSSPHPFTSSQPCLHCLLQEPESPHSPQACFAEQNLLYWTQRRLCSPHSAGGHRQTEHPRRSPGERRGLRGSVTEPWWVFLSLLNLSLATVKLFSLILKLGPQGTCETISQTAAPNTGRG